MKKTFLTSVTLIALLFGPGMTGAQTNLTASNHVIEEYGNGLIDWTGQFVEARGKSYINRDKFKIEAQAIDMAQLGAEAIAKANLLAIVQEVKVTRVTTVSDLMNQSDSVRTVTEGVIRGARAIGKPIVTADAVEVTVRMRLYDRGGLAPSLVPFVPTVRTGDIQVNDIPKSSKEHKVDVSYKGPGSTQMLLPTSDSTGLMLNFDKGKYNPSLFPVMVDEDGNVLLDLSEQMGKSKNDYKKYIEMADRVSKDLNFRKGMEITDAIQNADGSIRLTNVKKKPKLQKFLNILKTVGAFAIPLLL